MASGTYLLSLVHSSSTVTFQGKLEWTSTSNGTVANTSNVVVKLYARKQNSTTATSGMHWKGYITIDGTKTSYDTGSISVLNSWVLISQASKTVTHNSDGTKSIGIAGSVTGPKNTTLGDDTSSGSTTITLDTIPRQASISSAPNFTDIQNPTITYSNPAGNSVSSLQACISLTGSSSDIAYRDISKTGTSYTFNLTEAERNVLRQATTTSNTRTVYFYVKTVISGTTFYSNKAVTFSIVNANPTFNVAYLDTNSTTTNITGNNQLIIQNNSTLQINITNATALKYATLSSASVNVNGVVTTQSLSGSSLTFNIGTIDVSQNLTVPVTVTDSRGNKTTTNLTIQVLAWSLPNAIITLQRVSNYYAETNLTVDANYSSLNNNNTITIQYQIKKVEDASYGSLTTIQDNVQTQFTADNLYDWNVKVILTDRLGTTNYVMKLSKGIPIVFFDNLLNSTGFNGFPRTEQSVWSQDWPLDDVIYIGSQTLYDNYQMTTANKTAVLGSYSYDLIQGVFTGITIPTAYERAYRITAQIHTQNSNQACVSLNNFKSNLINTWSGITMRKVTSTRIFKESEIELEATFNYTHKQGCNLYCHNSEAYQADFWDVTVHGYLVKKTTNLEQVGSYALTPADNSDIEQA